MKEIKAYNIKIFGKKTITPPTPPMIPSTKRSFSGPSLIVLRMKSPMTPTNHSIHPIGYSPTRKVTSNMIHMKRIKMGKPNILCVTNVSINCVLVTSRILFRWKVSRRAPSMKP